MYNYLRRKKISSILTREPGGTFGAEIIRNIILKDYFERNKKLKFHKYTDTLLYLAARNEHIINNEVLNIFKLIKKKYLIIN